MPRETRVIAYACGYKYQLRDDFWIRTAIDQGEDAHTELVSLHSTGWLHVRKYFAWDGPSGATWDNDTNMRGSLVHDALYYLMRCGLVDARWKAEADEMLYRCMIDDGALCLRARIYRWAVRHFAKSATQSRRAIKYAPEYRRIVLGDKH